MQRHLPFEGVLNFRDFGGYGTADGRRVRWQRLFRSAHLGNLTEADHAQLIKLGVTAICDFRTTEESAREPSHLPPVQLDLLHLDIWPRGARKPTEVVRRFFEGDTLEQIRADQRAMYRHLVLDFTDRYAAMFRLILAGEGRPVLIHCRGGRDRTGFGAALILASLGVADEVIFEDYLRTNDSPGANDFIAKLANNFADGSPGRDRETLDALFRKIFPVRAENLQAAFQAIQERHRSIDEYLRGALDIDSAAREKLKTWFLE